MDLSNIKFNDQGLVPAIAQDIHSGRVLMLAWMNAESIEKTLESGYATYFSRSRQKLWMKGETSGHTQKVLDMKYDCDGDAILMQVEQIGPACHTGHISCFFNDMMDVDPEDLPASANVLQEDYDTIADRAVNPQEGSYTNYLLTKGVEKICKKVGEEATETVIAAMKGSKEELIYEVADVLYHLEVLMYTQGVKPQDIWDELARRR